MQKIQKAVICSTILQCTKMNKMWEKYYNGDYFEAFLKLIFTSQPCFLMLQMFPLQHMGMGMGGPSNAIAVAASQAIAATQQLTGRRTSRSLLTCIERGPPMIYRQSPIFIWEIWESGDIYRQSLVKTNQLENIPNNNTFLNHIICSTSYLVYLAV